MRSDPSLADGLAFLERHIDLEATAGISAGHVEGLSLEPVRRLLALLGEPHTDMPFVHLTGTNGKGSTAHLISRLLQSHGLTVGTYSSPHVSSINERFGHNGEPITDDELADVLATVELVTSTLPDESFRYFELLTAAALRWFADVAVDAAVVEVGMLGRYDATNVVDARVAVITNVGLDHTDGAPGWRDRVAREKAGIVKPGATLVLGETATELRPIFMAEPAAAVLVRGEDFALTDNRLAVGGRLVSVRTPRAAYDDVFLSLHGPHQAMNAAVALTAAEAFLDTELDDEVVEGAFAAARLPGRFEVVHRRPLVVIDGAHNPHGAKAAAATMAEDFAHGGRHLLVMGMLRGRDPIAMFDALQASGADLVLACTPPSPRALPAEELAAIGRSHGVPIEAAGTPIDAIERALMLADDDDAIFVVGSLYIAGEVRDHLADR